MELESQRNLAAALFRLEKSRGLEDLRREVGRMAACLAEPPDEGLRRSVKTWLARVLLPARMPGLQIPEIDDLEEVQAMLAERIQEWTREWKEAGLQEGRQEGVLEGYQDLLLSQMEERFGPVPEEVRRRIESLRDPGELKKLAKKLLVAPSIQDLGLS